MSMFPTAHSTVYYNEAGEPLGWDSGVEDAPDPDEFYDNEPEAPDHVVEIDNAYQPEAGDPAFAAFCSCGWRSEWTHADEYGDPDDQEAIDKAYDAAVAEGDQHTEEAEA